MKNVMILTVLLFFGQWAIAQTHNDSVASVALWNRVGWHVNVLEQRENLKYSSGKDYITYVTDESGMPQEASTYYYDGTVAMHSKLYSDLNKLPRIDNPDLWEFVMTTYYPNGQLRSTEFHFQNERLKVIYDEKQQPYYTEQISGRDTIAGYYITSMDENFNIGYRMFEQGKYIGTVVTDRNNNYVSFYGPISKKEAEKRHAIIKRINALPYPGF